jgi:hypothetical protein
VKFIAQLRYSRSLKLRRIIKMAGNSTITLQSLVDDAQSMGDLAPALSTGGWSTAPALSIANDVMNAMLLGGPNGQPFNWKWNRFNVSPFTTISYQQDYFVPGVVNLGWLEYVWCVDVNSTTIPKPKFDLEVRRDLEITDLQTGIPDKICWIPNDQAVVGTWGAAPLGPTSGNLSGGTGGAGLTGQQNPGPNVVYTNPFGQPNQPVNASTVIKDPNGNLWCLTTFGTCGVTEPNWPASPVYPTLQNLNATATTVADGTCLWTAINPKGQALRLNPIPPQTGIVYVIQPTAQMRQVTFKTLAQTLEPIPDDYASYFKQGFFAQCYRRNPDAKVRAKFPQEWEIYLKSLDNAVKQGQREMDDFGFYPGVSIMDNGSGAGCVLSPARPYTV